MWSLFKAENDNSPNALVVGIGNNKAHNFVTSGNVVLSPEAVSIVAEIFVNKCMCGKQMMESLAFRRRESKYHTYDFSDSQALSGNFSE